MVEDMEESSIKALQKKGLKMKKRNPKIVYVMKLKLMHKTFVVTNLEVVATENHRYFVAIVSIPNSP